MSRSVFGWDLPPGCTQRHIDEAFGGGNELCEVCCKLTDDCICPTCNCGETGNPKCYRAHDNDGHGMTLTREQAISRQEWRISTLDELMQDESAYLDMLKEGADFDRDIATSPNPTPRIV